jgi:hypothetical protein
MCSAPTHSLPGCQHPCLSSSQKPVPVPSVSSVRTLSRVSVVQAASDPIGSRRSMTTYDDKFDDSWRIPTTRALRTEAQWAPGGTRRRSSLRPASVAHSHIGLGCCQNIFWLGGGVGCGVKFRGGCACWAVTDCEGQQRRRVSQGAKWDAELPVDAKKGHFSVTKRPAQTSQLIAKRGVKGRSLDTC